MLAVPLVSPARVYGWLCLTDRIGAEEFTQEDERLAGILAAQVGRIYENGSLYAEVQRHAAELEQELLERRRAEEALRNSEARQAAILQVSLDAIITMDHEGKIRGFNRAAERIFGYPEAEVIGKSLAELIIPPSLRQRHSQGLARYLVTGEGTMLEKRLEMPAMRADGSEFSAELTVTRIPGDGRPMFTGYLRDVTERKRAEEHIQEQATLLNIASNAIMTCDLEGRILYWNKGAERLYGWTAAEALGKTDHALLFQGEWPDLREASERMLEKGEWCRELSQVNKQGKEVIVESRWTLVRDEEGRPVSRLVINTDITEKKKLEAQHLRAQRMESLGILAGGIAHDLNNVLTPILMAIEFLKIKFPDPESKPLLKTLQDSAERGAAMVKQVLSFARGTEGQRVPVSLKHAAKECQRMLEHTLPKSIRLAFSLPGDLWLILADTTQISQVLMNLCVNARDAMPHGGRLTIAAQNQTLDEYYARMHADARPGPYVVLSVSDTGTGIPPEILDRIFEPFFTTKRQGEGTGLGLSTVLGIIKSHGGFVNVYSEVGKGTKFSVYLPAAEFAAAEQPAEDPSTLLRGRGELILVVDDELSICEITKATLEMFGYRALTANDGAEAVALFLENRKDIKLVLTDMMMPVMDGAATIWALRKMDPHVPIIAASGLTASGQAAEVQVSGVQALLRKPYTADTLLTTLREVLDRSRKSDHGSGKTSPSLSHDGRGGTRLASSSGVP